MHLIAKITPSASMLIRQRREEEGPADSGRPSSPLDQLKSYTTTQNTLSCDCPPSFVLLRGPGLKESSFLEDDPGVAGIFAERGKKELVFVRAPVRPLLLVSASKIHDNAYGGRVSVNLGRL